MPLFGKSQKSPYELVKVLREAVLALERGDKKAEKGMKAGAEARHTTSHSRDSWVGMSARPVFQLTQEHRPKVDGQLGSFGTKAQTKHRLSPVTAVCMTGSVRSDSVFISLETAMSLAPDSSSSVCLEEATVFLARDNVWSSDS
ncbi:hypothetical protein HPB49_003288 [Dermacentor silvarum]|uniref:Uncharacterized protein n=1 Tax=Dermacentor silvarum TaxID=543639 RepID=A0ACB8DAK6_DERSI|nr:hypothetical protein HPB49_003288 [Dermacentor silvarum]